MQAVNYEILKGKDPEALEEKVNEKLKRGWVLVGGPFPPNMICTTGFIRP